MEDQASINARRFARLLRARLTDAERSLWWRLRGEQLGVKFRRQHPLGNFVLDFVCLAPRLVVEVDGSQHLEQVTYDERRTAWLNERGFRVVRFWAHEVLVESDAVVQCILDHLEAGGMPPPPRSSPRGGGRRRDAPASRSTQELLPPLGEGWDGGHRSAPDLAVGTTIQPGKKKT